MAFEYLKGNYKKEGDRPFSRVSCNRTQGNCFKLKEGNFTFYTEVFFFILRMVRCWNRLSIVVVDASSLETLKVGLDEALSNLI